VRPLPPNHTTTQLIPIPEHVVADPFPSGLDGEGDVVHADIVR
jgi:hypothetical protein